MFCRGPLERIVKDVFTSYGGSCRHLLTDKYGEDPTFIFDLMDQGGEQVTLRYHHTLARYVAISGATGQGCFGGITLLCSKDG